MIVTRHAAARWAERFPDLHLGDAYARARRGVGRKTRAKLRAACPAHVEYTQGFKGRYFLITHDRIVFVMTPPETIVTVFRL